MDTGNFLNAVNKIDYDLFKTEFLKQSLSEKEKQNLLIIILENGYNQKQFAFYKLIFDLLIDRRLNLNFVTDDIFKTPFLQIVIKYAPHVEIFEYFIDRGANINFYDTQDEEPETILDYSNSKIDDTLFYDLSELYYNVKSNYSTIHNDKVCVNKEDYEQLINQSSLLYNLRYTTILRNHIIATGGKTFRKLSKNK
ncbi:hypothetical protein [Flavobacterium sp.]|uniref:hypothetical protein n=1 Tax=Flavobacterium sp. TaxID=239 RepID=UPI003751CE67